MSPILQYKPIQIKMVSRFVSNSKPKNKKNGPYGRAHLSISKAVQQSSSLKSRKAMGRRIGTKRNRQKRDVHIIHKAGPDIIGKFFYYQWDVSKIAGQEIMVTPDSNRCDVIDVSKFKVINTSCISRNAVVLDGDDNNNFIFAKLAKIQSNECMGGRKGLNKIRRSFSTMKKIKPNQRRGKNAMALSSSYKLFGYRKEQLGKVNGKYVFKNNSNGKHSIDTFNNISFLYCNLSYNMEIAARRIGNSLYETGVYEIIQSHSNVPTAGISKDVEDSKRTKTMATALAVGENYWSKSHTDNDFYYTALSVLSKNIEDNDKILYYFIFPKFKLMVPMTSGDVLLFNPSITHSCSNPSLTDSYIFSSYVSKKTVLTAEVTMENERTKKHK